MGMPAGIVVNALQGIGSIDYTVKPAGTCKTKRFTECVGRLEKTDWKS
jgi:hypothetical protein